MIIFGTKYKHNKICEGDFFCPRCNMQRHYHHKKMQRYFSLYFIPIIPMGSKGEFIECQTCGTTFEMTVLQMKAAPKPPNLAQMMNNIESDLKKGKPVEFIIRDLTRAGLDLGLAQNAIAPFVDKATNKHCKSCGLTYLDSIKKCSECGNPLL